jgi:transcriptional regulator with XRE-family HTH domain
MQNIREARQMKGITQEQLAKMLGITQGAVAQWENGLTHPSFEMLPKVAEALGLTVDELIGKKAG